MPRDPWVWTASPELFSLGFVTVRWYGLLFMLGFVVGYALVRKVFRDEGRPERDLESLLLHLVVGTIVGARLGHCLFYEPEYYLSHPLEILKVWRGGLASHGGVAGVLTGLWLYARRRPDQPFLWLCDRNAAPVALASCFIRIGNLFNSEILGEPSDLPWAVVFARAGEAHLRDEARHPAQVYEALAYLAIFVLLWSLWLRWKARTPRGLIAGLFLVLVFGARMLIELVKERQETWTEGLPLTAGQILSIPVILLGLGLIAYGLTRGRVIAAAEASPATAP